MFRFFLLNVLGYAAMKTSIINAVSLSIYWLQIGWKKFFLMIFIKFSKCPCIGYVLDLLIDSTVILRLIAFEHSCD